MKNLLLIFLSAIIIFSCKDDDLDPRPDLNENVGAVTLVQVNPDKNFFNLNAADFSAEEVEFTVDVDGFDITGIRDVEVQVVYTDAGAIFDPLRGGSVDSVFAPIVLSTLTSFPSTVSITTQAVADALGLPLDSLQLGDDFQVTLPINTTDGRTLTTALSSDLCNQPAQPSFGGCGVAWAVACPSTLDGIADYTITSATAPVTATSGTIEWVNEGPGVYSWDSYTFGGYQTLYGCCEQDRSSSLKFSDVCNELTMSAADGFGCPWQIVSLNNTGAILELEIFGGCMGGYVIEMTRQDGQDWPPLFN